MANYLDKLNEQQKKAVLETKGPVFVIAGPGTGKTRVLTTHMAYLVENKISPNNILAVTFTNKAARDMNNRVINLIGITIYMPYTCTFHSFCMRFLKRHIEVLNNGLNKDFSVCDEKDSKKLIKEVLKECELEDKFPDVKNTHNKIVIIKTGNYDSFYIDEEDIFTVLEKYKEKLIQNNLCDFDDLILYTREILEKNQKIRSHYQNKFKHILVDEFQDTDKNQYEIIKLLSNEEKNIFVVGDPDQSIYSFRGACFENNINFIKEYKPKIMILDLNYRSTNYILDCANRLIEHNENPYYGYDGIETKNLHSNLGNGLKPFIINFEEGYEEADFIINEIIELNLNKNIPYNQIAVLYRSSFLSRLIEEKCMQNSIPYFVYGGKSFFERREIKDIIAYLRIVISSKSDFYLQRIINVPKRKIGEKTVAKLSNQAKFKNKNMFDTIPDFKGSAIIKENLNKFYKVICDIKKDLNEDKLNAYDLFLRIIRDTNYEDYIKAEDIIDRTRLENIYEFGSMLKKRELLYDGTTKEKITKMLDEISLMTDVDKNISDGDKVILATYHQVKGLEYDTVFMMAMEEENFPAYLSLEEGNINEERRVCYMGISRAKKRLYLTHSNRRYKYGENKFFEPSTFLKEIKPLNESKKINIEKVNKSYNLGDKVYHKQFGEGVIVSINEDVLTIGFNHNYGIKKIILNHPSLKKISNIN